MRPSVPPAGSSHGGLRLDPITEASTHWDRHGWSEAVDGMAVVTSVMRVQQLFSTRIERLLRPMGLTFARYEVLMLLHFSRAGSLPLGKIGARLQVNAGSVTNAIDRLEADRLVERRSHQTDGRAVLAAITDAGRTRALEATPVLNREVFAPLSAELGGDGDLFGRLREIRAGAGDFTAG